MVRFEFRRLPLQRFLLFFVFICLLLAAAPSHRLHSDVPWHRGPRRHRHAVPPFVAVSTPRKASTLPSPHDNSPILSASQSLVYMHAKWTRSVGDLKRAALLRRHHVEMRTDVNDFTRESYIGRHCGDTSLRVATFNLFNLQMQWGTRKAMAARALAAVAPDIIALQEVRFSTDKHQAFEIQQFLLSENGQLAYPHLIYQRVSSQDIGREEGLAILSRHPVLVWGFCVLTTNAQASPVQWFSDSGLDAPSVPDHSRIVLFARINTVIDALSPMKSTIVDVFVTHWPVADRDQCAAAMQSIAFADFVWRHKQVVGSPIIPQILTGDLNVYIDFEWPVDLVTGQVLSSDVNKCWQFWQSNFDAFQRTSEKVWFRDSFDSLFPELTYTNPHICSEKQRSASLSVAPCLDAGHTFPFDSRADSCRPDRSLVRDALSADRSGAALLEVFASTFGEQQLSVLGETITPSDHRGLLTCYAPRSGSYESLKHELQAVQRWRQASRLLAHIPHHVPQDSSVPPFTPKSHFVHVALSAVLSTLKHANQSSSHSL